MKTLTIFLLAMLLMSAIVSAGSPSTTDEDIDEFEDDDDDDEKERQPIAKRQYNAVRDTLKNVVGSMGNSVKLLTNAKFVKGVTNFVQKAPSATGSAVSNFYQAVRSTWKKSSSNAQLALIKQLQELTKRLSKSRLMIGNIGAKLTNREESATKNTKADEVVPTILPKQANRKEKSVDDREQHRGGSNHPHPHVIPHPLHPQFPFSPQLPPIAQAMQPIQQIQPMPPMSMFPHTHQNAYFAPPPMQPLDPMIVNPMYGSGGGGGW